MTSHDGTSAEKSPAHTVAFFCAEYALGGDTRTYAGGLGVLAADFLYQAGDENMPFVAIGFRYAGTNPAEQGFDLVNDCEIEAPIEARTVRLRTWKRSFGSAGATVLYLLDPDTDGNAPEDRAAGSLYDAHLYTRVRQQILTGIGGFRLLKKLGIEPKVYHVNEGNMAFAALAVLAEGSSQHLDTGALVEAVRGKVVATKHTILPAGVEIPIEDLWRFIGGYCESHGLDKDFIMSLGAHEDDPDIFAATKFLLRLSGKANAVSVIHATYEKEKHPASDLVAITNGVYPPRWQSPVWRDHAADPVSDEAFWQAKRGLRKELVDFVFKTSGARLDPDVCTVVWTRRFVPYKRPLLLFEDPARLKALVTDPQHPIQIVISGTVYEADSTSRGIEEKVRAFADDPAYAGRIAYVPGYSIEVAEKLAAGADVWLNTPIRGQEACGTSGMKAGLNGALEMSVSDGWMDEVDWTGIGWVLPDAEKTAGAMYDFFEREVAPIFADRSGGAPVDWVRRMRATMQIVASRYTAARALKDYRQKLYGMI